jgi:predicted GIY-YIG superfamily endonuclease
MDGTEFYCYLLVSDKRTYIGATVDPDRRLQQHNGMKSGGARATKGKSWSRVCYVSGFPDWTAALQFEWTWKHISHRRHGVGNKLDGLISLIQRGKSSSSSMPFILWNNHLCIHFTLHDTLFYEKIDKCNLHFSTCACLNTTSNAFCTFPFQMSVSDVSPNSISQLASMVEALRAEVTQLKDRLDATLLVPAVAKKTKGKAKAANNATDAPVADAAPAAAATAANDATAQASKKKGRKPKTGTDATVTPVQPTQTQEAPAAPKKQRKAAKKAEATEATEAMELPAADALDTPDAPAADAPVAKEPKKRGPKAKAPVVADLTVALEAAATTATTATVDATKVPKKRGPKAKETTA